MIAMTTVFGFENPGVSSLLNPLRAPHLIYSIECPLTGRRNAVETVTALSVAALFLGALLCLVWVTFIRDDNNDFTNRRRGRGAS